MGLIKILLFFQEIYFPLHVNFLETVFRKFYINLNTTSSADSTLHIKNILFPVELKLAPGGITGTSNVRASSSASVASNINTKVSPNVTLITVMF